MYGLAFGRSHEQWARVLGAGFFAATFLATGLGAVLGALVVLAAPLAGWVAACAAEAIDVTIAPAAANASKAMDERGKWRLIRDIRTLYMPVIVGGQKRFVTARP